MKLGKSSLDHGKLYIQHLYHKKYWYCNIKACKPYQNGTYNIGTSFPRSFKDIVDILQKELGTKLEIEYFPNPYSGYQHNTQANISTSIKNINFKPTFSLEQGIKEYLPEIKKLHSEKYS